MATLVISLIF